ncbi:MAG: hypothetical protein JSS49_13425 [Planctomycetes bacterium]|nr:hypothetical protein [Planctomycetota bacterium]
MKHVLSIGQCSMDHRSLGRFLQGNFDVEIVPAATAKDATTKLREGSFDLVLVNRQFDADGHEGLDFIQGLKQDSELATVPVMLVTNFREYADQAVSMGALPGFGKAELGSPDLVTRLSGLLAD